MFGLHLSNVETLIPSQGTGPPQSVQVHRRLHRGAVRLHHHGVLSQRKSVGRPAQRRHPHQLGLQVRPLHGTLCVCVCD